MVKIEYTGNGMKTKVAYKMFTIFITSIISNLNIIKVRMTENNNKQRSLTIINLK